MSKITLADKLLNYEQILSLIRAEAESGRVTEEIIINPRQAEYMDDWAQVGSGFRNAQPIKYLDTIFGKHEILILYPAPKRKIG